jgi:uncharacterized glyoxalase superfamily protein PhnB
MQHACVYLLAYTSLFMFWGAYFGVLTDKFGIKRMINGNDKKE